MTSTTTSIFGLVLLIGSISATRIPKIVGGNNATIKHFPYIVSIRNYFGYQYCGGAIISDRHILTAAHCVEYKTISDLNIHSGTSRIDREGNKHEVFRKHVHPSYGMRREVGMSDDIAVLTLRRPIVFNKYQQKINLPSHDIQNYDGGYVVGWGFTTRWNTEATQLKKLRVILWSSEKCKPHLNTKIDKTQVCALRRPTSGVCYGDSGGPLVSHGEVVGIASHLDTRQCADTVPDIYTNVFAYKDFIESAMKK